VSDREREHKKRPTCSKFKTITKKQRFKQIKRALAPKRAIGSRYKRAICLKLRVITKKKKCFPPNQIICIIV